MILIDAIYIHETGGKVLLDYFVSELEKTNAKVCYLFDNRVSKGSYKIKDTNKVFYEEGKYFRRLNFYVKNKNQFTSIFCFANVPPPIKTNSVVYTFLHQYIYLDIPKGYPFVKAAMYFLKTKIIKALIKNTNYWIVQNENIRYTLSERFKINSKNILSYPFYPEILKKGNISQNPLGFIYVSNPFPHKNYFNLIDAFCKFYDQEKKGELVVTVDKSYKYLYDYIKKKICQNYPIKNIGFVNRDDIYKYYASNRYLIFPSFTESFGLGIIEAIECGCDVIGADLPYLYQVCEPSLVFDPYNIESIKKAFITAANNKNIIKSQSKVTNEIKKIIDLLVK